MFTGVSLQDRKNPLTDMANGCTTNNVLASALIYVASLHVAAGLLLAK